MPLAPLWWDGAPFGGPLPSVEIPTRVDVAIVGGGFTGLWTAYYLLCARPELRVVVLEAEHVGFGASGRNGGWASALWPVSWETVAGQHGAPAARALIGELRHTVEEVARVCREEPIEADVHSGGTIVLARSAAQAVRAKALAASGSVWGDGTVWLDADEARSRLDATEVQAATFNPHCARVQPRRLIDGLAAAVIRRGGLIAESSAVADLAPGSVLLASGRRIAAGAVIRATEAWTATLPSRRRAIAPVYSLIVATEPLTERQWEQIGLADGETFSDHRHVIIYGQRTIDGRIVFGGRGAPYHLGSGISPEFDSDDRVFDALRSGLVDLLPQLDGVRFTHAWGGPLGIARDWHPSVGFDQGTRVGWAGGYVGDGVAATNLAGRTLADLVCGVDSPITHLPWVGHRSPDWEPEPLRWLGVNAGLRLAHAADVEERLTSRPSRLGSWLSRITGH